MTGVHERDVEEGVLTYDARPLQSSNRPVEAEGFERAARLAEVAGDVAVEAEPRWGGRELLGRLARASFPQHAGDEGAEERDELVVQVATVFGYAMIGAVLFHVGWWMITAG